MIYLHLLLFSIPLHCALLPDLDLSFAWLSWAWEEIARVLQIKTGKAFNAVW